MIKSLYFVLAIIFISISLGSCNLKNGRNKEGITNGVVNVTVNHKTIDCYSETLKWRINDSTFFDTLVFFRNYIENDSSMRVSCVLKDIDPACESLIYGDKNIRLTCEGFKQIHRHFLMSYNEQHPAIILSLYLINLETTETYEFRRYQIVNHEITGINVLPYINNEFTPYDKYNQFTPFEM